MDNPRTNFATDNRTELHLAPASWLYPEVDYYGEWVDIAGYSAISFITTIGRVRSGLFMNILEADDNNGTNEQIISSLERVLIAPFINDHFMLSVPGSFITKRFLRMVVRPVGDIVLGISILTIKGDGIRKG